jgi:hypothetical protein
VTSERGHRGRGGQAWLITSPAGVPRAGGLKTSSVIMMAALVDLLVIVPYSYWRLNGHRLVLITACSVAGIGALSLLGIALYLRRRGS